MSRRINDSVRYSQEESDRTLKKLEEELKEEFREKKEKKMKKLDNTVDKVDSGKVESTRDRLNSAKHTHAPSVDADTMRKEFDEYLNELVETLKYDYATTSLEVKVTKNKQQYAIIKSTSSEKEHKLFIYNIISEGRNGKATTTILVVNADSGAVVFSKCTPVGISKCDKWVRDIVTKNVTSLEPKHKEKEIEQA